MTITALTAEEVGLPALDVNPTESADVYNLSSHERAREAIEKRKARGNNVESVGSRKELSVRFLRSPRALVARDDDATRLGSVVLEVNELTGPPGSRRARGTGATETIRDVALALRSVGYKAKPLEDTSVRDGERTLTQRVPFDATRGIVPNAFGRVTGAGNRRVPGLYVAGWLKRGPKGIIGDNLIDAEETIGALIEDDAQGLLRKPNAVFKNRGVAPVLAARDARVVSKEGWARIDAEERRRGAEAGKPREKLTSVSEMLRVANERG